MADNDDNDPSDPLNAWRDVDGNAASACFEEAVRRFYDFLGRGSPTAEGLSDAANDVLNDSNSMQVIELMTRAYITWANHGIRYWGVMTERHGQYVNHLMTRLSVIRNNPDVSESERRALIDEAEQYLREIADLSMHEGRALKMEMERLSSELRSNLSEQNPNGEPRRYGGVKP